MASKKNNVKVVHKVAAFMNSIQDFSSNLISGFGNQAGPINELSSTDTLYFNLRWYLLSNFRQLLSQLYVEHGIVQTLVDQPVDDAFRAGMKIKTQQLDEDQIEQLDIYCQRNDVYTAIKQAKKWTRLYGGGAVILITDQDPKRPFNLNALKPDSPLEFRPVDMWELFGDRNNTQGSTEVGGDLGDANSEFFDYYGHKIHHTRVYKMIGKIPPSFIRPRLRGWGLSSLEPVVRSMNQYFKNQDLVFQLLNEAKIDVYRLDGFNEALTSAGAQDVVTKRVQAANMIKNFLNALVMDKEDEYDQKQLSFSGLDQILMQIRQGIAADLKMPMTKLFGMSATGFNSGEDDIENYNSMIEGEIREPTKFQVLDMLEIACHKLFGFCPDDMTIEFNSLRILGAEEEEKVKDMQFNRALSTYQNGLGTAQEIKRAMNTDSLLSIELDETSEGLMPVGNSALTPESGKVEE